MARNRRMALLSAVFLGLSACAPAAQPVATPAAKTAPPPAGAGPSTAGDAALAAEGRTLIAAKGCGGCHVVPGVDGAAGAVGPSLAGVAGRNPIAGGAVAHNGPDDLKRWIMNPPAVKPGTTMPSLGLTDDEANKIVAYLETLR